MHSYIKNLLPRLQQISKSLEKAEIFVQKPWILIDEAGRRHQYIFERGGNLIMSLDGQAKEGSWRYIAASNSLLVNRGPDSLLLNQAFVYDGLMFLKRDGTNDPWILINEDVVPDLDAKAYLIRILPQSGKYGEFKGPGGKKYYYAKASEHSTLSTGTKIYDEELNPLTINFDLRSGNCVFKITGGVVTLTFYEINYATDKGTICIQQDSLYSIHVGDGVFQEGSPASDGEYTFNEHESYKSIDVENGKVKYVTAKTASRSTAFVGFSTVVVAIIIIILIAGNQTNSTNSTPVSTDSVTQSSPENTDSLDRVKEIDKGITDGKSKIASYLKDVNGRQFTYLQSYFAPTVNYFGTSTDPLTVVKKIEQFWSAQLDNSRIDFFESSIEGNFNTNSLEYEFKVPFEEKSLSADQFPYIQEGILNFCLNEDLKITSTRSRVEKRKRDIVTTFNFRNTSEYSLLHETSKEQFNEMFSLLRKTGQDTSYFNTQARDFVQQTILEYFPGSTKVFVDGLEKPITLSAFLTAIVEKRVYCRSVTGLFKNSEGLVNGINVDCYIPEAE